MCTTVGTSRVWAWLVRLFRSVSAVWNTIARPCIFFNWAKALSKLPGLPSCSESSVSTWSEPMMSASGYAAAAACAFNTDSRSAVADGVSPGSVGWKQERASFRLDLDQRHVRRHRLALFRKDADDDAGNRRLHFIFHFHRFDYQHAVAGL